MVPPARITQRSDAPLRLDRQYVLYWMTASRRVSWNYAMDRAVDLGAELKKPVLVLEALRCGYPYASARLHRFVVDGMRENAAQLSGTPVGYYPYVEPTAGAGRGLLRRLAADACAVVTDDYPSFMIPRMTAAAAGQVDVRLELVDSNGLLPMRATNHTYVRAFDFRRYAQRELARWVERAPRADPVGAVTLPRFGGAGADVLARWPVARLDEVDITALPIDHEVPAVDGMRGGRSAALGRLAAFDLGAYAAAANHPDDDVTSGLSAYLHFGHVGVHEIFAEVARREEWSPQRLAGVASGAREGWWGMSAGAERFLDQLCTWRELGFNMCVTRPDDYLHYASLPAWALRTLAEHAGDERPWTYSLAQLERAQTHDDLWNAAQRQLRVEGRIHNYLRMLWGKKILHWTESPEQALAFMLHLNDRWALDGRDPNSAAGIFWVLGRYDRAFGPERAVFGKVRTMTTDSAKRKLRVRGYLERWGDQQELL